MYCVNSSMSRFNESVIRCFSRATCGSATFPVLSILDGDEVAGTPLQDYLSRISAVTFLCSPLLGNLNLDVGGNQTKT